MTTISASTTLNTGYNVTSDTTGTLVFQTGASPTTAMTLTSSGGVAFGSSGSAYGSSGQVLQSNGNAAPTWVTLSGVPAGAVEFFAMNTAPTGYLKANGAAISRTTYATLFSAIGTTFGTGDGSTTFNIPDMRGYFPRGWVDNGTIDSGRTFGSTQTDAIRNITGGMQLRGTNGGFDTFSGAVTGNGNNSTYPASFTASGGQGMSFNASLQVPTAADNRPYNVAFLACIKY